VINMVRRPKGKGGGRSRSSPGVPRRSSAPGFRAGREKLTRGTPRRKIIEQLITSFEKRVKPTLSNLPEVVSNNTVLLFGKGIERGIMGDKEIQRFGDYSDRLKISLVEQAMMDKDPPFKLKKLIEQTKVSKQ